MAQSNIHKLPEEWSREEMARGKKALSIFIGQGDCDLLRRSGCRAGAALAGQRRGDTPPVRSAARSRVVYAAYGIRAT